MLQALGVTGVLEHVPVAAALVILGWIMINKIMQAWQALRNSTVELIKAAIDSHVKEHHTTDEEWRKEMREHVAHMREELGKVSETLRQDIKDVHRRIDRLYRAPEDSQP